MSSTFGSAKDPFRALNISRVIVSLAQLGAVSMYAAAFGAFRYHDQVVDPWQSFVFYRFASAVPLFLLGLMLSWVLWDNYGARAIQQLQFVVAAGVAGVGAVHLVWMIVDWTNCNDNTGIYPDVPWCRNRYAPVVPASDELADFSFFVLFISQAANLMCAIYWVVFGQAVKSASSALIVRAMVGGDSMIASEYTNRKYNDLAEASADHAAMLGQFVGAALHQAHHEQKRSGQSIMSGVRDGDEHLHRIAGGQLIEAMYRAHQANPNSGGLPSFSRFLDHSLGDNLGTAIAAHGDAVVFAASAPALSDKDNLRFGVD